MLMSVLTDASVVRVRGGVALLRLGDCPIAVVIGPAERHDRGSSTLSRDSDHQQPHQKRSEQQTHGFTLQQ